MKIIKSICQLCNKEKLDRKSRKFCSRKCAAIYALNVSRSKYGKKKNRILICPKCNKEFIIENITDHIFNKIKDKKYCSRKCANGHIQTEEQNQKRRKTLLGRSNKKFSIIYYKTCKNCNKFFITGNKKRIVCSKKCQFKYNCQSLKTRLLLKITAKKLANEGIIGWKTRKNTGYSYPEKFWKRVLDSNNLVYSHNYKISKYELDFAFLDKMIDLEIDGKQHEWPERKIHDKKRDIFLKTKSWKVYRIKWKNINTEEGKKYIKNEIDKFLKFYQGKVLLAA